VRSKLVVFAFTLAATAALAGCGDPTSGLFRPQIVTSSVEIFAAGSPGEVPTALSVAVQGGIIEGGRFPERAAHAGQWEVVLVRTGDRLYFHPPHLLGFESRAGITQPLTGRSFADLRDAPGGAAYRVDAPVPVEEGSVYAVRSRDFAMGGMGCVQYAKIQPTEVNVSAGTVRLQVATNARCYDTRLVAND
jgi:hypothetical protein